MKIISNKGKNSITLILTEKTFEKKVQKIRSLPAKTLSYLNYKNKTDRGSKPPKAIHIIFKIGYSYSTRRRYLKRTGMELPKYFYNSVVSDPTFIVTPKNALNFAADSLVEYSDKFNDMLNDTKYDDVEDIYNVRELTIVYIY